MRALVILALASCTHDIDAYKPLAVQPPRDLDVLFVLDDSANRANYDQMVAQLDVLQTRLSGVDGQLPSLHVGVATTDLGTSGTLDAVPVAPVEGCTGDGKGGRLRTFASGTTGTFLEDLRGPDGARSRNFASGDLALELGRLMNPTSVVAGCEYEQPLEAMRRALDPATNPGFIRPGAMLAVVFLTNEDDCSLARGAMLDPNNASLGPPTSFRCTEQGVICDPDDDPRREGKHFNCRPREDSPFMVDVSEYKAFLEQFKPDRRDVVVSAVVGPRESFLVAGAGLPSLRPSCQGPGGTGYPAVRIGALVDSFGGAIVDTCTQEGAYQKITAPIVNRQRSCFPSLRRTGEACSVIEVVGDAETELDACAGDDAGPCWYTIADAAACPEGDNLGIAVNWGEGRQVTGSRLEARCFVR